MPTFEKRIYRLTDHKNTRLQYNGPCIFRYLNSSSNADIKEYKKECLIYFSFKVQKTSHFTWGGGGVEESPRNYLQRSLSLNQNKGLD